MRVAYSLLLRAPPEAGAKDEIGLSDKTSFLGIIISLGGVKCEVRHKLIRGYPLI